MSIFVLGAALASASTISLDSGTSGSYVGSQSYNETRAVDVTVLSPVDLGVSFMTLSGIQGSGTAKAVIYDSNTQSLIASAQGTLTGGSITLPISATLLSTHEYRIGFFGHLADGNGFLPSVFPYTESSGLLRINGAFDFATDNFPANSNLEVPLVSLQVSTVPEPKTFGLAGVGLLLSRFFSRRQKHGSAPEHRRGLGLHHRLIA